MVINDLHRQSRSVRCLCASRTISVRASFSSTVRALKCTLPFAFFSNANTASMDHERVWSSRSNRGEK